MRCVYRRSTKRNTYHDEVYVFFILPALDQAHEPPRTHLRCLDHECLLAQKAVPRARALAHSPLVRDLGCTPLSFVVHDPDDACEAAVGDHALDEVGAAGVWVAEDRGRARVVRVIRVVAGF